MDSSVEKGSGSLDPDERMPNGDPKACTDCNTTKTPLWRGGPCGPKSLCNACGIRYRKKRREALGLEGPTKRRESAATAAAAAACTDSAGGGDEEEELQQLEAKRRTKKSKRVGGREPVTVELRMVGFGKEVVLKQRRRMRRKRRLGEEEKAAILLMALSSGVIYAS